MTKTEKRDENLTLERQRVVNALISAAVLRLAVPQVVVENQSYVRASEVSEDVVAGLGVNAELVRLALESAVQQGMLLVPESLPVSEHPITLVRPGTL
jgi:hypothetical protein